MERAKESFWERVVRLYDKNEWEGGLLIVRHVYAKAKHRVRQRTKEQRHRLAVENVLFQINHHIEHLRLEFRRLDRLEAQIKKEREESRQSPRNHIPGRNMKGGMGNPY